MVPSPPTNLNINVTLSNLVILTWESSGNNVDDYFISYGENSVSETNVTVSSSTTTFELINLKEETLYQVAINSRKDGKLSSAVTGSFTTLKIPGELNVDGY